MCGVGETGCPHLSAGRVGGPAGSGVGLDWYTQRGIPRDPSAPKDPLRMSTALADRLMGTEAPARARPSLARVATSSPTLPDRVVLYGPPGWGKTSFAARLPQPVFLMSPGEDRLPQLIAEGLVGPTAHFPDVAQSWADVETAARELLTQPHDYQTFVLDTGNGAERLAQEEVCSADFGGDWGDTGFASFGKGEKVTANRLWAPFLVLLDRLRAERRMRVVVLCHAGVRAVKDPMGTDYEKVEPSLSKAAWQFTSRWADMILCGAFELQVRKDDPKNKLAKAKGHGGRVRLLHTQAAAAYDAKNARRLPPTVRLGDDPARAYDAFRAAFPKAPPRAANNPSPAQEPVDEQGEGEGGRHAAPADAAGAGAGG